MRNYYGKARKIQERLTSRSIEFYDTDRLTAQEMVLVDMLANMKDEHGEKIIRRVVKDLAKYVKDTTNE